MIFTDAPEVNPNLTLDDLPGTFGDAVGASAESALYNSPVWQLKRTWDDNQTTGGLNLDYETARSKAKEAGVDIQIDPKGMTEGQLSMLIERKRFQARTQDALARGPHGFTAGAAYFMSGLGAAMLDPINLASAFIPVARGVGMAGDLALAGRLGEAGAAASTAGRVAARLRVGAVEGGVGQAMLEPLTAYRASQEQEDYGITDTLMNVGFGTVLGAVAHTGLGAIGDRIAYAERGRKAGDLLDAAKTAPERAAFAADSAADKLQSADMETNAAIFRSEVAAAADGRKMDNSVLVAKQDVALTHFDNREKAAVGDWVRLPYPDSRGIPVAQVRELSTKDLYLPELDAQGRLQPEKRGYVAGYADRLRAGETAPLIDAVEMEDGRIRVVDGHRRVMAAQEAGQDTVRVLVSPLMDSPEGKVPMTAEAAGLRGNQPIDPIKVQQAAIASHLPENDVHYDAQAKAEVDKAMAARVEGEDPAAYVAQATQEAQTELAALAKQLGMDPEKNAAMRSADEVTATASRYAKAIEAYVSCQART